MINQINKMAKSMANEMNNKLLELLTSVGFKCNKDVSMSLIEQAMEFTEENNITIKQEKVDNDMYYILRKDDKKICYFYTSTEYFVEDEYCCKGTTFVSDVIFY